jgi:hypothetical protein
LGGTARVALGLRLGQALSAAKDSPALSDRMVEFDSDPELPDE